jgi:hypothetical protein
VHIFAESIDKFLMSYLLTDSCRSNRLEMTEEGTYLMIHCLGYILLDKSLEVSCIHSFLYLVRAEVIKNCFKSHLARDYNIFNLMQEVLN